MRAYWRAVSGTAAVVVAALAVVAVTFRIYSHSQAATAATGQGPSPAGPAAASGPAASGPVAAALPDTNARRYVGVFESSAPSWSGFARFSASTKVHPQIAAYFSGWNEPFQASFAAQAHAHGAVPFVEIQPANVNLRALASGADDAYLRSYARQVVAYRYPVIIGFGHEMNGDWYSWGWTHASPAAFIAAYRHVVRVFRRQGASNVTWIWVVNVGGGAGTGIAPAADYWPGAAYVDWAGIDGYYFQSSDTFAKAIAPTVRDIRKLTGKPILLSETAIGPVAGQTAKMPNLFAGIRRNGLIGLVWFDETQSHSLYQQDWRLEGHPAAIAAFRRGVASMTAAVPGGSAG